MDTLLFLHGWATDKSVWEGVDHALQDHGDILKVGLPGHGGAGIWSEATLSPAVKELTGRVSKLPDRSVIGVGWSLGGEVLLSSYNALREKFKALVLVGANPCFVEREDYPWGQSKALVKRMIMDMKKDPAETVDRFYALNFTEAELKTEEAKKFILRYRYPGPINCSGEVPGCFPAFRYDEITTALQALCDTDLRNLLSAIDTPALIVHGGLDAVCPAGAAKYLADNIKGSTLKLFEDAGHAPFITERERFNGVVREFLKI